MIFDGCLEGFFLLFLRVFEGSLVIFEGFLEVYCCLEGKGCFQEDSEEELFSSAVCSKECFTSWCQKSPLHSQMLLLRSSVEEGNIARLLLPVGGTVIYL